MRYILLVCMLYKFNFPVNLKHNKAIKNINV